MSLLPKPNLKLRTSATALLAASILLFPSFAQQAEKPHRIGILSPGSSQFGAVNNYILPAFQRLGYDNGTNGTMEIRYAEGRMERLPELAADLVRLKVDVIVAVTNMSAFAAKEATATIPIVVWAAHDAVGTSLVRSLARPGGNVTGVESMAPELDIKRIELLKEILPGLSQLAVLYNAADQGAPLHLKWTEAAARQLGIRVFRQEMRQAGELDAALAALARERPDGLLIFTDPLITANRKRILDFAKDHRLPVLCEFKHLADDGCLVSYGPTFAEMSERVARQADRILNGAKPAALPIEQPTRMEMVINRATAKALGITIPQSLSGRTR